MLDFSFPIVLGAIVATSTVVHAAIALQSSSPWIVPDELIYSELAKSIGDGALPRIRDEVSFLYGLGYPLLLAPVWAAVDDVGTAYAIAKVLNAFVLSLTAVPAFFLARRFVTERDALVVSGFSVAVPSMLYAGTLMTEVALYPAFVLALLAIAVALERPHLTTQAAALGAIAVVSAIKILAALLIAAYVVAIALYHWLDTVDAQDWRARMRAYTPTWAAFAVVVSCAAVVGVATGHGPERILGAYSVVLSHVEVVATPWWAVLHLAELALYVAIVPFATALLIIGRGLRRYAAQRERLFAAITAPVALVLVVVVGAFASTAAPGGVDYPENVSRLHERSTFVLTPLLLISFALWFRSSRGRLALVVLAVAGAALLPALIPIREFDANVRFQALALVPWVAMREDIAWPLGVLLFTTTLGVLFIVAVRARASLGVMLVPVALMFAAVGLTASVSMRGTSDWTRSVAAGPLRSWVDAGVPGEVSVSVLWAESDGRRFVDLAARHRVLFIGEFFNRSIGTVYELGTPLPYGLPATRLRFAGDTVVLADGRPVQLDGLVLVPCHVHIAGDTILMDAATGAAVFRVEGPVKATITDPAACPTASRR